MFGRALLLAAVLVMSGCAVGERPTLTDEGAVDEPESSLEPGAVGASMNPAATSDTEAIESELPPTSVAEVAVGAQLPDPGELGDVPPVLISPTGVVVPVLGRSDDGYTVQTPCGLSANLLWGQPVRGVDVVLDPGHGGDEPGAISPSGSTEAELNLDVARRAATMLEARGYTVALTRAADYRLPIPQRAAIADQLGARALISIHHNSPTPDITDSRGGPGTEVYVQSASDESKRLGSLVHQEMVAALEVFDADWASRTDAGVLVVLDDEGVDAYGITRRPATPSVLAELAYLSNPTEALVLGTPEYRQSAAEALANSVARFLETPDTGSELVNEPRLFNPSAGTGGSDGCVDPILE